MSTFKRMLALLLSVVLVVGLAACGGTDKAEESKSEAPSSTVDKEEPVETDDTATDADDIEKPEKIVAMIDTVFGSDVEASTWASWLEEFENRTGIAMEFIKPDHNQYYEQMSLAFTAGTPPDIMEIGSKEYPTYATNGALWDMGDAWENSELKAAGIVEEKYVDILRIDDVLYGFPMAKGNGTLTYMRADWLENLGLEVPTTYEEFLEVLRAFTHDDPDGDGQDNTYGFTSAGLINEETPYDIYPREFYQEARPEFYKKDGAYIDGMSEPAMVDALNRMKEAYKEGLIDREIITNKTSTAREKFYAGEVGVFNYWAGNWNVTLENNLQASNPDGRVVPVPAIAETTYVERPPTAMAITNAASHPEAIFKHVIEYSHDGGEGQLLFTRGIEGEHYTVAADGSYEQVPDPENPQKMFEKTWFSPELSFTTFDDPITFDERLENSLEIFAANSDIRPLPVTSDVINENLQELIPVKNRLIATCVTGDLTAEDAIAQYEQECATYIQAILDDLNQ